MLSEHELLLRLEPEPLILPRCGRCRAPCALVHERLARRVRERDLLGQRVWLEVALRRVECLSCGGGPSICRGCPGAAVLPRG